MIKPETKYLVVAVRKSDGQTFFPENPKHRKGIDFMDDAIEIAERKTQNNSDNYDYVVYRCEPVVAVELETKPIKRTYFIKDQIFPEDDDGI